MNSEKLNQIAEFYSQTPQEMYELLYRQMLVDASVYLVWLVFFGALGALLSYLRIVFRDKMSNDDACMYGTFLIGGWVVFLLVSMNSDETYQQLLNPKFAVASYIQEFDIPKEKNSTISQNSTCSLSQSK